MVPFEAWIDSERPVRWRNLVILLLNIVNNLLTYTGEVGGSIAAWCHVFLTFSTRWLSFVALPEMSDIRRPPGVPPCSRTFTRRKRQLAQPLRDFLCGRL